MEKLLFVDATLQLGGYRHLAVMRCPFCGSEASLFVAHRGRNTAERTVNQSYRSKEAEAFIKCRGCGLETRHFRPVEKNQYGNTQGMAPSTAALTYWNNRHI